MYVDGNTLKFNIDGCVKFDIMTEEFYGRTIPDVELVICDMGEPTYPTTISRIVTTQDKNVWNLEHEMRQNWSLWILRQVEELKTRRDYEVVLDSCTYVDSRNFTIRLPVTITSLIGEFCTPVISSGMINLLHMPEDLSSSSV